MVEDQDEDALFERLERSLGAIRRDAELARSGGVEGMSAGLARAEDELRSLAAGIESLRHRFEQQEAVTERLEAAAAKNEADLQGLRQTVETLSRRVRDQAELLAEPPAGKPPRRAAALIAIALAVLVLGAAGAVAWIASGRDPTAGALAQRFVARLSELTGIDRAGPGEPTQSGRTAAQAAPDPDPPRPRQASPAADAVPAPAALPSAAVAAPAETASAAPSPPAETPTAALSPPAATPAAAPPTAQAALPPPAEMPAVAAPSPAKTAAAIPLPSVTPVARPPPAETALTLPAEMPAVAAPSPAATAAAIPLPSVTAASSMARSETQTPAATVLAPSAQPPRAIRRLMLRATADTWVQVRQKGGDVLLRRIMKAGATWPVPAEPDLILDTGNAEGLDLEVDGVPTRLTGAKGGVVRNLSLDADLLGSGAVVRLAP